MRRAQRTRHSRAARQAHGDSRTDRSGLTFWDAWLWGVARVRDNCPATNRAIREGHLDASLLLQQIGRARIRLWSASKLIGDHSRDDIAILGGQNDRREA